MKKLLNTLYVTNSDAYIRKKDDAIAVYVDDKEKMSVPFHLLEGLVLFGHVGCSTSVLGACAQHGISVVLLDERGRYQARVEGCVSGNVLLRRGQYRWADDEDKSLCLSRRFVAAKIKNARFVLQRAVRDYPEIASQGAVAAIDALGADATKAANAFDMDSLRGFEGDAARTYFKAFNLMVRDENGDELFKGRSRRPPRDPVNAALSFFYTMLAREIASACESVGLDPQMGFFHKARPGRASLALDLIEELRAPYVDRFVLSLFNRKQLQLKDFTADGEGGVFFTDKAMKRALSLWQEKKQEKLTHPFLGEKMSIGLISFVQAQLLARTIRGDLDDYPAFLWR